MEPSLGENVVGFVAGNKEFFASLAVILGIIVTYILIPSRRLFGWITSKIPARGGAKLSIVSVFISAPITTARSLTEYRAVVAVLGAELRKRYACSVYTAYSDYVDETAPASLMHSPNRHAAKVVLQEIEKAQAFALVLDRKLPTSCYVEVGIAIALRKPIAIFYEKDTLPWMLHPEALGALPELRISYFPVASFADLKYTIVRETGHYFAR